MKILLMEEYGKFRYADAEKPVPDKNEVLIRIMASAVCGSDVHGMDGSTGRRQPPVVMGHEAAGIIEQCGDGVKAYHIGDRVTFDSTIYCNSCKSCLEGNVNLCENRRVLGVSCDDYRMSGAFAEYITVPEYILYPIPDNLSYIQAAMVEPLAVAYHAAMRAPVSYGSIAAVVGVGTIGLLLLQVLKSMGARTIAVDIDNERLQMACESGADYFVNSSEVGAAEQVIALTGGRGVDAAYDATGISETVNLCAKVAKLNGHIILIGNVAQTVEFPLQSVVTRQQSLYGSCASAGEYRECLELIVSGKVNVNKLISRVAPLADGNEWMNRIYNKEPGLYKIIFEPWSKDTV